MARKKMQSKSESFCEEEPEEIKKPIFDRQVGGMNFLFGNTTILFRPLDIVLIMGICVTHVHHDFNFIDPDHVTDFRQRRFLKMKITFGINDLKAAKNLVRQEEKVTTKMYHVEKMDIFQEYGGQLPEEELGDSAPIELELSVRVEEVNIDNWDDEQEHRKGKIVEVICLLSSQDGDQLIEIELYLSDREEGEGDGTNKVDTTVRVSIEELQVSVGSDKVNPDEAENAHDDPLHTGEGWGINKLGKHMFYSYVVQSLYLRLDSLSPNVLMTRKKAKKIGTRKTRKKLISHELIADQISQQLNFHDCGVNLLYSLDTILREGKFQIEIELYLSDREEGEGDGTNKVDTTVRVSIEELQVSVGSDKVDQASDENGHGGKNKVGGQEPADEKILKDIDVVVGVRVGVENINTMSRMLYSVKS
ncbi:hypothetical protein GIB67_010308 [Kingdonia uniflora]|uniref:Uncharacterized protein n=1 Tax=Kingdonia uniflora TaxID=39325 RepID=A0A7J7LD21_9MAGN|nr:hypothetical protein GIB67_010308 [Kingdonia uniflora]